MNRAEFVAAALGWVGTPWHHQAHTKGLGCDCAGLVRGVMIECGLMPADVSQWPGAGAFLGYGRQPDGAKFLAACDSYLERIDYADRQPGDVIVVRFQSGHPQHIGILTDCTPSRQYWIEAVEARHKRVIHARLMFDRHTQLVAAFKVPGL